MNERRPSPADHPPAALAVARLFVFPLKSARGFSPAAWPLDGLGLAWDRRWLVARPDGAALTQREEPRLATLTPELLADRLRVHAPGALPLEVPLEPAPAPELCEVRIFESRVTGASVPGEADAWLSRFLGYAARLVRVHEPRRVKTEYAVGEHDATGFADAFPLLVVGQASLDELNGRLPEPLPMDRFRPNLVIAGAPAFAEDGWRRIRAGEVELALVKPCARCVITTTDQLTGARGREPLRTLATFRRSADGKVLFGQNAIHLGAGMLRVDDVVSVMASDSTATRPADTGTP